MIRFWLTFGRVILKSLDSPKKIDLSNNFYQSPLEINDNEPTFAEPWQAEVLAIAEFLIQKKKFSANQWSEALGNEIKKNANNQTMSSKESYYRSALTALESLTIEQKIVSESEITSRENDWQDAYLRTPHGKPVILR